jgi:SOS response regulatory protein OraA/RecX
MTEIGTEIFKYAVKLLGQRDYSIARLREKIESKFGQVPEETIEQLIAKRFLNDRRFAENHVSRHKKRGKVQLKQELLARGIREETADEVLAGTDWLSLTAALKAKMDVWHLRVPLQPGDAARLFRAMARLGYEEDAIREEIEQLSHEQ